MALRGVGVGAEKNQLRAVVAEHNRVAGQLNVNSPRKLNDVFFIGFVNHKQFHASFNHQIFSENRLITGK
ncbi:hypothetical protein D3C85_1702460 [compost metagenome]